MPDARISGALLLSLISVMPVLRAAPDARGIDVEQERISTSSPSQPAEWPPPDAVRPGSGVTVPRLVHEIKPRYTVEAMKAKIQGFVLLESVVETDGRVNRVRIVRSLDPTLGLDEEAVKAARQWRFTPGSKDGIPVPVLVTIELTFQLRDTPRENQAAAGAVSSADGRRVDAAALSRETQGHSTRPNSDIFVQWMPVEIWTADSTIPVDHRTQIEQLLAPYVLFMIGTKPVEGADKVNLSERELREHTRLIDSRGKSYAPLGDETLDELTQTVLSALRTRLAAVFGAAGMSIHLLLFPNDNSGGTRTFPKATEEGSFSLSVGEEAFSWKLPLQSLVRPR